MCNWDKGPDYVPTENPRVRDFMNFSSYRRRINASEFENRQEGDVRYCAWCDKKPVKTYRHKYCSDACKESLYMFIAPTDFEGFYHLLCMQKGVCRSCSYDFTQHWPKEMEEAAQNNTYPAVWFRKHKVPKEYFPEMDHIVPVACGGSICGHDNIQLICRKCHKLKTKDDRKEIAANPCPKYMKEMSDKKAEERRRQEAYDKWLKEREDGKDTRFKG